MLENLLPPHIFKLLLEQTDIDYVCELRLRLDKPLYYSIRGFYRELNCQNAPYLCKNTDIDYVMFKASKNSLYAFNDCLLVGYIPCSGGIRIGVVGEGVSENGLVTTIKNITSLCIRLPHQIIGCADSMKAVINNFDSTLILSKPGLGKTTILRDLVRQLSNLGYNILALDDRYELSGTSNRTQFLDLGKCTDTACGLSKNIAYANHLRTMRPDIIATDEVFGAKEVDAIIDAKRCGVKIIATLHCEDLLELANHSVYKPLVQSVRYLVMLGGIGQVDYIFDRKLNKCIN